MYRFTTDNPKNNLESALNLFYAKDGEAWIRGGGPEPNYDDVTLFVFIRRVIKALLQNTDHVDELENDTLSEIMFDWLQDGPESIPGVIALLYESAWAFAEIRTRLAAFEDLEMTPEAIENQLTNFSSFLMEMTGGRMSKTNYTVQAMVAEANNHFESVCDECSDRQEQAEIKKAMETANETKMMFATEEENHHDKETFVRNLGWLLSQTREQVERCYLDEEEQVHVVFRGGSERTVNVKHDSYTAIIRDVAKAL